MYDRFCQSFREKIAEIDARLSMLQDAEDNYYITAKYLLDLTKRAYALFKSSEVEEKRQLIKLVLQNPTLDGKTIHFQLQKPFDTIVNYADSQLWLPSPEILIRITESIITAFSDSVSFESVRNKWSEIKKVMANDSIVLCKLSLI